MNVLNTAKEEWTLKNNRWSRKLANKCVNPIKRDYTFFQFQFIHYLANRKYKTEYKQVHMIKFIMNRILYTFKILFYDIWKNHFVSHESNTSLYYASTILFYSSIWSKWLDYIMQVEYTWRNNFGLFISHFQYSSCYEYILCHYNHKRQWL